MNQTQISTKQLRLKELDKLLENLKEKIALSSRGPFIIAIYGRGGAGKSTIVNFLKEHLQNLTVLPLDDIVHPLFDQNQIFQFARHVLKQLRENRKGKYQKYDWGRKMHTDWIIIKTKGIVLIDGLGSMDKNMFLYYDLKIWIDCDKNTAFKRGWQRDKNIYHINTMNEWIKEWIPKQEAYITKQHPKEKADIIFEIN